MSVFPPDFGSDVAPPGLDIFSAPANQVAILRHYCEDVRPVSQFHGQLPLEFDTNLQGDVYIDLRKSKLFLKVRILKLDGNNLAESENVAPVNLLFHALFNQIDIYMNGAQVSTTGSLYPYTAFFHNMLNHGERDKRSFLTEQLCYPDSPGYFDATMPNGGNAGLYDRFQLTKRFASGPMVGLPLNDILTIDRYLLNGIRLRIVMNRTPARFCLMCPADDGPDIIGYQVRIEDAYLRLCKLKINPAIIVAHNKLLNTATAKYPYIRRELRVCNLPAHQSVFNWDNI